MPVKCRAKNKTYSESFHLINWSNGEEAKYNLGDKSQKHNWCPKIVLCLFNIGSGNSYGYYKCLVQINTPDRRKLKMKEVMKEMKHAFCRRGATIWSQRAEHPT